MFDTWHGNWLACPSMTVRRAGCAAALLPDGRLFVAGGYDERGIVAGLLASCETFDPVKQLWSTECAAMGRARWGHGCATLGRKVYIAGGCALRPGMPLGEDLMETLRTCEAYDPSADTWSSLASLHVARAGARLVLLAGRRLAVVGGCDDVFGRAEMLASIEVYNPVSGAWALLPQPLSVPRTTAAAVAVGGGSLLVMGGAPSLASMESYQVPEAFYNAPDSEEPGTRNGTGDAFGHLPPVCDMAEGRMGCQAIALELPPPSGSYPVCTSRCVVLIGGENGDEDWDSSPVVRQFRSVLVYDLEAGKWRPEEDFPPIPTPRTAMALCTAPGRVPGHR
jgi:hypothetical protein